MSRATAGILKVILGKAGTSFVTAKQEMGLRRTAELNIDDVPVQIENDKHVVNYKKFSATLETVQCNYDVLKDVIQHYLADEKCEAHIVTNPQKATADSSPRDNLKGNEVYNFTYSTDGNGFMGIKFKLTEEFGNNKYESLAKIDLQVAFPKSNADSLISQAKVSTSTMPDTKKPQNIDPMILSSLEHPLGSHLIALTDLLNLKIELESAGDGESAFMRPYTNDILATITLQSKKAMSEDYLSLAAIDENAGVKIVKKISNNLFVVYDFLPHSVSRSLSNKNGASRMNELVFKGKVPLFKIDFTTSVVSGITYKIVTFN